MRRVPQAIEASWPPPNYNSPDNQGPDLLIAQLTLLPLAMLALVARLWVRIIVVRRAGWDDLLMVIAMTLSVALTITVILATEIYGWKIHVWDLPETQLINGRKASIAAQTLFIFASGTVKLSILVSYLRIAPFDSWFRRFTLLAIPLVTLLLVVFLVVLWTQCIPASHYWNNIGWTDCIDEGPPLISQTIMTVVADFIVYILPLPTMLHLSLPLLQRIVLVFIFSLGLVVVFAGCMRTYWVTRVVAYTYDVTWDGFWVWIWTAVEVNLGVICGCAPLLKPMARYIVRPKRKAMTGVATGAYDGANTPYEELQRRRALSRAAERWLGSHALARIDHWTASIRNTVSSARDNTSLEMIRGCLGRRGSNAEEHIFQERQRRMESCQSGDSTNTKAWKIENNERTCRSGW